MTERQACAHLGLSLVVVAVRDTAVARIGMVEAHAGRRVGWPTCTPSCCMQRSEQNASRDEESVSKPFHLDG